MSNKIANFFRMMLFSILNFKDMLDIIEIANIVKKDQLNYFLSFFSTLDCTKAKQIYDLQGELRTNQEIKRVLFDFFNIEGK